MQVITNLGVEQSVSSADKLNGASLVRIYNDNASDVLISLTDGSSTTYGSLTLKTKETIYLSKNPSDYLVCGSACKVVSVGYSH